jgi:hypothetical protein
MDRWETGHGAIYQGRELSCSHCGSLHPDRFMALAAEGWSLTPTNRPNMVYLGPAMSMDEMDRRKARWRSEWRLVAFVACREDTEKPTPDEVEAKLEELWLKHGAPVEWNASGMEYKFYFSHLSTLQQHEFLRMYNECELLIGYPGYFDVLPFFAVEERWDNDTGTRDQETTGARGSTR